MTPRWSQRFARRPTRSKIRRSRTRKKRNASRKRCSRPKRPKRNATTAIRARVRGLALRRIRLGRERATAREPARANRKAVALVRASPALARAKLRRAKDRAKMRGARGGEDARKT